MKMYFLYSIATVLLVALVWMGCGETLDPVGPAQSLNVSASKKPAIDVARGADPELEVVVFVHYPAPASQGLGGPSFTDEAKHFKVFRNGYRWLDTDLPVEFNIDASGSGVPGAEIEAAKSLATWNAVPNTEIIFDETLESVSSPIDIESKLIWDEENTISWGDLTSLFPRAISVNRVVFNTFNWIIVESDIVLNNAEDFTWGIGSSTDYDIQNIITHELGHSLFLDDLYGRSSSELTMYGYSDIGEDKKQSLGLGDKLGAQKLYGN